MRRIHTNLILYFLTAQPTIFLSLAVFPVLQAHATLQLSQFLKDLAAYIAIFMGFFWTLAIVPAAYLTDSLSRRVKPAARRPLLMGACALTCAGSSLALLSFFAYWPLGILMHIVAGAFYGAVFRTRSNEPTLPMEGKLAPESEQA